MCPSAISSSVNEVSIVLHLFRRWSLEWITWGASKASRAMGVSINKVAPFRLCCQYQEMLRTFKSYLGAENAKNWEPNQVDCVICRNSEASQLQLLEETTRISPQSLFYICAPSQMVWLWVSINVHTVESRVCRHFQGVLALKLC